MKSKSLSPASAKSTLSAATVTAALIVAFLVSGCYVPPSNKSDNRDAPAPVSTPTPDTSSNETTAATIAEEPQATTRTLTIDTPTPGWKLDTLFIYLVEDELWCLHQLTPPEGMVAQMLSSVSTEFTFVPPSSSDFPLKHFVVGKTWNWKGNPEVTFLDTFESIQPELEGAAQIPLQKNL